MRLARQALPAALVMGAALVGCGTATTTVATSKAGAVGCVTQGATAVASTASYRVVLDVRPVATMFAPGQVPAGTSTGEVMYAGSMTSAGGADARDVNIHICSEPGNRVLTGVKPVISLEDRTTGTTQAVPYATMQGVGQGQGDFHYGNTMVLAPGDAFTVTVTLDGQTAHLSFTEPRAGAAAPTTMAPMKGMKMSTSTTMAPMKVKTSTTTMAGTTTG